VSARDEVARAQKLTQRYQLKPSMIVIVVIAVIIVIVPVVFDEVCVRKHVFRCHEFVFKLTFAHETGGNIRATRAVVDELVGILADGPAHCRKGRIRIVEGNDRVRCLAVLDPIDEGLE
jgi:hypothetical protein